MSEQRTATYSFDRLDECPACREKPGSPYLCKECIERRDLRAKVESQAAALRGAAAVAKKFESERDAARAEVERLREALKAALASTRCRNEDCDHSWHRMGRAALVGAQGETSVVHLARVPFRALCGANEPNQRTTDGTYIKATCAECVALSSPESPTGASASRPEGGTP